jgi:hypothetical protein
LWGAVVTEEQIENERGELIGQWRKAVEVRRDWSTLSQITNILSIVSGVPSSRLSRYPVRDLLREFHNILGYKALNGGLCAGSIFRTQSFIITQPRIGSKDGQTVHIEHTVPICILEFELKKRRFFDAAELLVWLLKHSVATAFRKGDEKKYLKGVSKTTNALDPHSSEQNKPFLRYKQLFADHGLVWNVFDKKEVEADRFTFDDHIDVVARLLKRVGAEKSLLDIIERYI